MQLQDNTITIGPTAHPFPFTEAELFAGVSPHDHQDLVADNLIDSELGVVLT